MGGSGNPEFHGRIQCLRASAAVGSYCCASILLCASVLWSDLRYPVARQFCGLVQSLCEKFCFLFWGSSRKVLELSTGISIPVGGTYYCKCSFEDFPSQLYVEVSLCIHSLQIAFTLCGSLVNENSTYPAADGSVD